MNDKFIGKAKRALAGFVAAAVAITMLPAVPANAEDSGRYPYTLFAGSSAEGAITTTASNFGVNGNVATNGTISAAGNMNINGTKTENADLDMIYILDKIDSEYFSGSDVEEHTEDYVLDELNINISEPTEVLGEAELTGNININTALKAFKDVTLNGEVKNTDDSVIYSKYGDIVIDSTNVNLNGLVYAPFGSVEVKAMNLNLNNVVIIADSIVFDCPNVNANYSTNAADFVGTVSEPLNIPKDEWQYMKDENENGLPDFFENFENWSKLADSDGDGLPDSIEEYLGSDPNNIDTDEDGLNDFYEVFSTFTDPTKADTDDNGVSDGDEDFDEDGLNNLEEFDNETNPYIADTDGDSLSDGDEVNTYGTDPLVADTDGDGLDDGDEIIFGTNPLVQDTDGDGIIDSKEKFQQTFTHKVKNDDCAVTEVVVDMECTGNINKTTSVESVMNTDILCTDVVGLVGEPFEIETESEFDKATLTFKIDKDKLGEIPFDNLLFLWYNEEDNEFVELETILDEAKGTASITTTHFSKYMVVDQKAWFENWREIYARFEKLSEKSPSITAICVDCSGSMSTNDPFFYEQNIKTCYRDLAVQKFIEAMFDNDKTSIITYASSALGVCPLTNDKEMLNKKAKFSSNGGTNADDAVGMALRQFIGVSGNKSIILLSDGDVNVSNSNLESAKNNSIKIHAVALGQGANSSALKKCAEKTDGEFFIIKTASELESIYDKLSADNQLLYRNLPDTDGDGVPDDIEISGIPMPNGVMVFTDPTVPDTDDDGLSDGDEVGKMRRASYFPSDVPDYAVVYKFSFDVTSNPKSKDTDGDDYDDYTELTTYNSDPMVNEVSFHRWNKGFFSVDYAGSEKWTNHDGTTISYGGNQCWFYEDSDPIIGGGYAIEKYGCGLISPSDVLLYLALTNPKYSTFDTTFAKQDSLKNVTYDSYQSYIKWMNFSWFDISPWIGVPGTRIARAINQYSQIYDLDLNASWNTSKDDLLSKIETMLDNDIPVTFSIGPQAGIGILFYDWIELENDKYNFQVASYPYIVNGHYATITGLLIDDVKGQIFLEISSWGKRYYVNYDNYLVFVGVTSNIVYIK